MSNLEIDFLITLAIGSSVILGGLIIGTKVEGEEFPWVLLGALEFFYLLVLLIIFLTVFININTI